MSRTQKTPVSMWLSAAAIVALLWAGGADAAQSTDGARDAALVGLPDTAELVEAMKSYLIAYRDQFAGKAANVKVGRGQAVRSVLVSIDKEGVRATQHGVEIDASWERLGHEGVYLLSRSLIAKAPAEIHASHLLLAIRLGRAETDGLTEQLTELWKKNAASARHVEKMWARARARQSEERKELAANISEQRAEQGNRRGAARRGPPATLLFLGDFEHGPVEISRKTPDCPWSPSGNAPKVVSGPEPVRYGRYSMKSFVDRKKSPCSYRTEAVPRGVRTDVGKEYWYGFSIFFPVEWTQDNLWELVAQWHGCPDFDIGDNWRNPLLAFFTDGVNLTINNIWDPKPNTFESGKREYGGSAKVWRGPIDHGVWTDWVVHVFWSYGPDGTLEIWRNGAQIVNRKGPNCFNDKKGPYLKLGIYKGWKDRDKPEGKVSQRFIYHDEVRIAGADGRYEDVAPPGPRLRR